MCIIASFQHIKTCILTLIIYFLYHRTGTQYFKHRLWSRISILLA
uniref:Uncharacterized protein n=1 Tax=Anguilla anguilla TaxID=7936 RepID=A0A0E9TRL6_ANGAN